jgi:hypothetical protein
MAVEQSLLILVNIWVTQLISNSTTMKTINEPFSIAKQANNISSYFDEVNAHVN